MLLNTTFSYFRELLVFTLLPYFGPYVVLQYVVPIILKTLGFGLQGILLHSIASRIQSKYGTSYLFSLLQSIGARGGNLYPKIWSGIIGTMYELTATWTNWQSRRHSSFETEKFKQAQRSYPIDVNVLEFIVFGAIVFTCIILYFCWRYDNSLQIMNNNIVRVIRSLYKYFKELISGHPQRLPNTAIPIDSTNRSSSSKVTEILPRNPSGGYSCPQCKKEFKPQGITNHVKSCAKEWCKKNGICTNKN
jgi:hypothetical protein